MANTLIAFFSRADENYFGGAMRYVKVGNTEIVVGLMKELIEADIFLKRTYVRRMNMRKGIALFAAVVLMLTGCGSSAASQNTSAAAEPAKEAAAETQTEETQAAETPAEETQTEETQAEAVSTEVDSAAQGEAAANADKAEAGSASDTLVIYFSRTGEQYTVGVIEKGNTAIVAEMIAEQTGADLFEVLPADDHYPMTYDALTEDQQAKLTAEQKKRSRLMTRYIDQQFRNDLKLTEMADVFKMNASYLSDYFRRCMGMSFHEYLTRKRLQYAVLMLNNTENTVLEIALDAGFPNSRYRYVTG